MADEEDDDFRTLNVKYPQIVLVDVEAEEFRYVHHVLLCRVEGAVWISGNPNHVLGRISLDDVDYRVCVRNGRFPAEVEENGFEHGLFAWDPVPDATLRRLYNEAKLQASLLGGAALEDASDLVWRYCDYHEGSLAEPVPQNIVEDAAAFVSLGGHGVALVDGCAFRVEQVSSSELESWTKLRREAALDQRLFYPEADGPKDVPLDQYVARARESKAEQSSWSFPGPLAAEEWLVAISTGSGNFNSYHAEWVRLSGVYEGSASCHEHRHGCELLRLAKSVDGWHLLNSAVIEHVVRRMVQIERAVARNPRQPDFSGLSLITEVGIDRTGAAHASKFDEYVTERQQKHAFVLKQTRLYTEEVSKNSRSSDAGAPDKAPKGEQRSKKKAKGAGKGDG